MSSRTRREFLQIAGATAALASISEALPTKAFAAQTSSGGSDLQVFVTNEAKRYAEQPKIGWSSGPGTGETITVDANKKYQPILGFGGAFTDAACWNVHQMPQEAREELLHELFDPSQMGLSVGRVCIGSSDYSRNAYSYDDGDPDPELKRFSIEHDREYILPTLRSARQFNPELFLLGTPWSPPGWMKSTKNTLLGGTISRSHLGVYAQYMVKFLQAYQGEGVVVNAVSSQNEVDTDQDGKMPACSWPQEIEVQFVGEDLGPSIEKAGLNTKIWLIDHNYNLWGRAICELDDPNVQKYTKSIAWHGYLGKPEWMQKVLAVHPDAEMYWTEGGPDYTAPDYETDWVKWSNTFTGVLRNSGRCIIAWNLVLDEVGKPNIGPFPCGGVVTVNSQTKKITRSGQYWAFAHYSRTVRQGATRIESSGDIADVTHVAFSNPDGGNVVVVTNSGESRKIALSDGAKSTVVELLPKSVTTLTWR